MLQATTAEPVGFDKCRKGWFPIDTGGFVCSTIDVTPFATKRFPERQPLQPDLTAPLPYPYGYSVRRNTPMYRRLPNDDEAVQYEGLHIPGHAPPESVRSQASAARPLGLGNEGPPAPPGTPDPSPSVLASRLPTPSVPASGEEAAEAPEPGVPTLASLMGEEGSVLMRRMERGFYVSLDRELEKNGRKYWRTQSNGFIPSAGLLPAHPSEFHGVLLEQQGLELPIGFVMSKRALAFELTPKGALKAKGSPGYHHMLRVISTAEIRGVEYAIDEQGLHYRKKELTVIEARAKPTEVGADEKWIDVDLATQSLVAYVGSEPVYATLISSGRIKDEIDPLRNFETPSGSFRIKSKHLTATMDGDHAIDGPYSIEDVPYVMYFELAYALHSAFWHDSFGRPHSHGCVNLAPIDAKWVFEFAEPPLPKGWHGAYPTPTLPGTRLYIHGETRRG